MNNLPVPSFCLVTACVLLSLQCIMSFDEVHRRAWYFVPVVVGSSALTSLSWCIAVNWLEHNDRIFYWSVLWEALTVSLWYFLPVVVMYVELRAEAFLALAMIAIGLIALQFLQGPAIK